MILPGALVAAVAMLQKPELLAVRCEPTATGAALKVLASAAFERVTTERSGGDVVIVMPAHVAEDGVPLPDPVPPLLSLAFVATTPEVRIRVGLEAGTVLEVLAQGSLLTLAFQSPERAESGEAPDVESLYPLLFPEASPPTEGAAQGEAAPATDESLGWGVGPIAIEPSLIVRYVDGEATFLDTPQPTRVRYLEIQPRIVFVVDPEVAPFGGRLRFSYEPRLRTGENGIPVLSRPSHFVSAGFEFPVGPDLELSLSDQYVRGSIETQALDPGGEYFFDIGSFDRNQISVGLLARTPGRLDLELGGSLAKETVEPGTGYFSNERRAARAALRYEFGSALTASVGWGLDHVPPPDSRPIAETRAHDLTVGLAGGLTPLLQAELAVGYRWQRNPRAPAGGDRYRGSTLRGSLRRDLPSGPSITLGAGRSAQLSAYESNAFYLANSVNLGVTVPLPMSLQFVGGATLNRNSYRLDASGLAEPRKDKLWGFSAGIGRPITSWSSLRADYSWSRRRSNVRLFETETQSFVVQLSLSAPKR